jgi:2-polyprenyl-6-hydroxyphenyl methylase/3-demethylubiquinone-9 3-methyltransferase
LACDSLQGRSFLDVGCGSGLFSLAARQLGARVLSFDYDLDSVRCTESLRNDRRPGDHDWRIEQGSVLDPDYLARAGRHDIVYSWGVLHHTGALWQAMENVAAAVAPGGQLFIAVYNDQQWMSRYWKGVKQAYNRSALLRFPIVAAHAPYLFGGRFLVRALTGRLELERGMSLWHDMIDWLGGYPFEVAAPERIFEFFEQRGFALRKLKTCGGRHGCNEFVFGRLSVDSPLRGQVDTRPR